MNDCELLSIDKDDFESVKACFDKKKETRLQFMMKYFPQIDDISKSSVLHGLLYLLEERTYTIGEFISKEGEENTHFFILYDGEVELEKSIQLKRFNSIDSPTHRLRDNLRVLPI